MSGERWLIKLLGKEDTMEIISVLLSSSDVIEMFLLTETLTSQIIDDPKFNTNEITTS